MWEVYNIGLQVGYLNHNNGSIVEVKRQDPDVINESPGTFIYIYLLLIETWCLLILISLLSNQS